ncbi:MAG: hypothetical protein ACJ76R_03680 [Solirubrobacteraceae bacterium]
MDVHAFTDLGAVAELLGDVAGLQATVGDLTGDELVMARQVRPDRRPV